MVILCIYEKHIKILQVTILADMENTNEIDELRAENAALKSELEAVKKQLQRYIDFRTSYYEKNKEVVNEKSKLRRKKMAEEEPERLRELNRIAYLKRKERLAAAAESAKIDTLSS
jgi:hypothetical protein